jgi:ParB-like chromosome segregation protein Spo0J
MKQKSLNDIPTEELIAGFAKLGIAQDDGLLGNDVARFNQLFDQMREIVTELKSRNGDHRQALMVLYDHPNIQVRLKAAKNSLAVAPVAARNMLETIAGSGEFPQAGEAGMSHWNLDRGVFKPS